MTTRRIERLHADGLRVAWTVATAVIASVLLAASVRTAAAESCASEIGRPDAQALVRLCLDVSPATRPPCNAANTCELIEDEITRSCRILGGDAPAGCRDYR